MILCRDFDRPQWVRIAKVALHYINIGCHDTCTPVQLHWHLSLPRAIVSCMTVSVSSRYSTYGYL